jgi:hypothetical protein
MVRGESEFCKALIALISIPVTYLHIVRPILALQTPHNKMPSGHVLKVVYENSIDQCAPSRTNDRHGRGSSLL